MSGRTHRLSIGTALIALGLGGVASSQAEAQGSSCGDLQGHLLKRKEIGERLSAGGKKQIDAKFACTEFGALVQNGSTIIKWAEANKDWCQIPDAFIESVKADHNKAVGIRAKACSIVAKQTQMEQQAKNGGGGLLGGNGLTGTRSLPSGAL